MMLPKPLPRKKKRKWLRHSGARGARYERAKQEYVDSLNPLAALCWGGKVRVKIVLTQEGFKLAEEWELHHLISRSRAPELRCDPNNFGIVCHPAHESCRNFKGDTRPMLKMFCTACPKGESHE